MRIAAAIAFLLLAAVLLFVAAGAFQNVWADNPDGPRYGFLAAGLVATGFALLPLFVAWRLLGLRLPRRHG